MNTESGSGTYSNSTDNNSGIGSNGTSYLVSGCQTMARNSGVMSSAENSANFQESSCQYDYGERLLSIQNKSAASGNSEVLFTANVIAQHSGRRHLMAAGGIQTENSGSNLLDNNTTPILLSPTPSVVSGGGHGVNECLTLPRNLSMAAKHPRSTGKNSSYIINYNNLLGKS